MMMGSLRSTRSAWVRDTLTFSSLYHQSVRMMALCSSKSLSVIKCLLFQLISRQCPVRLIILMQPRHGRRFRLQGDMVDAVFGQQHFFDRAQDGGPVVEVFDFHVADQGGLAR